MTTKRDRAEDQDTLTFSLPKELKRRIQAAASSENRSASNWLVTTLQKHLAAEQKTNTFPTPFLGAAAAGRSIDLEFIDEYVDLPDEYEAGHYVIRVDGDSMSPEFEDGDMVLVDGRNAYSPKQKRVGVFCDSSGSMIKRFVKKGGKPVLESINPEFEDIEYTDDHEYKGFVVKKVEE
ncbi:MAG: S24 family peptidase [Verrucomicrobiota bacterium]